MRRVLPAGLAGLAAILAAVAMGVTACGRPAGSLTLATTTTVENSGLLPALLPAFERSAGVTVRAVVGGSGRALDILDRGDADVALTHDPEAERRLFDAGRLAFYRKVMFNDFVIAGPEMDPSGVRAAKTAVDAMSRIAAASTPFASRGDSSGTHSRELQLWQAAGRKPQGTLLIETGQGMAATLRVASERHAYVLTDRSTFRQLESTLQLHILFQGDPQLVNTYAVMYTTNLADGRLALARQFVRWLTEGDGREAISRFQIRNQAAFTVWPANTRRGDPGDLPHAR